MPTGSSQGSPASQPRTRPAASRASPAASPDSRSPRSSRASEPLAALAHRTAPLLVDYLPCSHTMPLFFSAVVPAPTSPGSPDMDREPKTNRWPAERPGQRLLRHVNSLDRAIEASEGCRGPLDTSQGPRSARLVGHGATQRAAKVVLLPKESTKRKAPPVSP